MTIIMVLKLNEWNTEINKNHRIPLQKTENQENPWIIQENHENHENPKDPCEN